MVEARVPCSESSPSFLCHYGHRCARPRLRVNAEVWGRAERDSEELGEGSSRGLQGSGSVALSSGSPGSCLWAAEKAPCLARENPHQEEQSGVVKLWPKQPALPTVMARI